jgi:hypothetical protein
MAYGAIDLHEKERQIRIVMDSGEVLDRRIATTRDRFTAMFWGRLPMRVLVEAATESEWVAQHLETLATKSSWRIGISRRWSRVDGQSDAGDRGRSGRDPRSRLSPSQW